MTEKQLFSVHTEKAIWSCEQTENGWEVIGRSQKSNYTINFSIKENWADTAIFQLISGTDKALV